MDYIAVGSRFGCVRTTLLEGAKCTVNLNYVHLSHAHIYMQHVNIDLKPKIIERKILAINHVIVRQKRLKSDIPIKGAISNVLFLWLVVLGSPGRSRVQIKIIA